MREILILFSCPTYHVHWLSLFGNSIQATEEWVQAQIPAIIKDCLDLSSKDKDDSELPAVDVDMEALAQAHVNVLAGACLSIGMVLYDHEFNTQTCHETR